MPMEDNNTNTYEFGSLSPTRKERFGTYLGAWAVRSKRGTMQKETSCVKEGLGRPRYCHQSQAHKTPKWGFPGSFRLRSAPSSR